MELITTQSELEKNIAAVYGAIGASMPILRHILVSVKNGIATLNATDLSLELSTSFPVPGGLDGSVAVPAKKFLEIIKEMPPSGDIKVSASENNVIVITCGKVKFDISGLPAVEFPTVTKPVSENSAEFASEGLVSYLSQIKHAIGTDINKPNLTGAYLHVVEDKLCLVATDGHRLALSERKKALPDGFVPKKGVIIPEKAIAEICKMAQANKGKKVTLAFNNNRVYAMSETSQLAMRLVDADYPLYQQVIPPKGQQEIKLNRQTILQTLKRVSLMSLETKEGRGKTCLRFSPGCLQISSSNISLGDASEELEIVYDGNAEIHINAHFMMDALMAMSCEDAIFTYYGEIKPMTVSDPANSFLSVIMPMQR